MGHFDHEKVEIWSFSFHSPVEVLGLFKFYIDTFERPLALLGLKWDIMGT